ncbi:hypothetical protein F511_30766 [Dorcoceras hygrometricum]|uniref:Uncharacterized protein n=1 Tax=Dorcoceras hygrometricum TaxID=472368 RepID=A0A2Z7D6L8_9LAMI|nr:hypothetical protein F511_30766 [Dorcoceras hygrometricum]
MRQSVVQPWARPGGDRAPSDAQRGGALVHSSGQPQPFARPITITSTASPGHLSEAQRPIFLVRRAAGNSRDILRNKAAPTLGRLCDQCAQRQPSAAQQARLSRYKRAAARAHARGEGAPPCTAAPMPGPKLIVSILKNEGIQLAVGPQPLRLRNHNSRLAHRIMVTRLATSPHDPLGITDSACKNQLVVVSVQYGPFNPYIPIRSTTIGKSRVAIDPIAMRTSWRLNSEIASVTSIGYPRMSANGESSTTMHRLLHASGSHPIPTPYDPKTNQYNQDLGLIHSTNGNHLESPKEGSSIDHQVTIYLHAQNFTMFPTNETWYFASQILVSNSGGLILILTAQSTRNMFRIHSDY